MKNKRQLIGAFVELGCTVLDQNGLLRVFSESGIIYLRSRVAYSKPWLYLNCYVQREAFPDGNWKEAYQYITSKQQKSIYMESFTNQQVRDYLNAYYVPTFTKGKEDHFYNHRNRKTIGLPHASVQSEFTEREVVDVFSSKTQHPSCIEIIRFKNHIANNQTV